MISLWFLAALLCQLHTSPPGQAEILETKLPPYTATVLSIDGQRVQVKVASETRSIPLDQLLRTRFQTAKKDANTTGTDNPAVTSSGSDKIAVELADGSSLFCSQIASNGKDELKVVWSDQESILIPSRQVSTCLLQPLDASRAKQWQAIVDSRSSSDVLILQRSSESLDKIEGVINQVSDSAIQFQFDGQTIDVQRTKLAGWKYFAPPQSQRPAKLLAVVRDRHGSNWMAQSIVGDWSAGEAQVKIKLVSGVELALPTKAITDVDFSFGSMRFLADLEPIERKLTPRMALGIAIPEAEKLFGPRTVAAESQRGATAGPGIEFMGSGAVTYRVPSDFLRLVGNVALTPEGPHFVPCKAQIRLEDQVVWEKTLTSPHDVLPVDVVVEPGKRVRLTVEAQSQQPVGDHVTWRQLRFVK